MRKKGRFANIERLQHKRDRCAEIKAVTSDIRGRLEDSREDRDALEQEVEILETELKKVEAI